MQTCMSPNIAIAAPHPRPRPSAATAQQHVGLRTPYSTLQGPSHTASQPLRHVAAASRQQRQQWSKQRRRLPLTAAGAEAGVTAEEESSSGSSLVPNRQGYRSFKMESCEFLVSETADGRLDLNDVYVVTETEVAGEAQGYPEEDEETGDELIDVPPEELDEQGQPVASAEQEARVLRPPVMESRAERAATSGELPRGPLHFHELPWYSEFLGNVTEDQPPKRWLWKVYLIALSSLEPRRLDMQRMWVMDCKAQSLARVEVRRLAPPDTPEELLRLRITRDGSVTIDTLESQPSWEQVVRAYTQGQRAISQLERQAHLESQQAVSDGSSSESEEEAYTPPPRTMEAELEEGEADEDNLRDFIEEWGDEDEEDFDADLSGGA